MTRPAAAPYYATVRDIYLIKCRPLLFRTIQPSLSSADLHHPTLNSTSSLPPATSQYIRSHQLVSDTRCLCFLVHCNMCEAETAHPSTSTCPLRRCPVHPGASSRISPTLHITPQTHTHRLPLLSHFSIPYCTSWYLSQRIHRKHIFLVAPSNPENPYRRQCAFLVTNNTSSDPDHHFSPSQVSSHSLPLFSPDSPTFSSSTTSTRDIHLLCKHHHYYHFPLPQTKRYAFLRIFSFLHVFESINQFSHQNRFLQDQQYQQSVQLENLSK
jgi:hypothetical protein